MLVILVFFYDEKRLLTMLLGIVLQFCQFGCVYDICREREIIAMNLHFMKKRYFLFL